MNEKEVRDKVLEVISRTLSMEEPLIKNDSKIEDLCKDSIQIFSLILAFEKELGYSVEYEDLIDIEVISDIINLALECEKKDK